MDGVFEWLKAHYQYVLIAGGLLFLIGAIRDWKWVYQATGGDKARHAFIFFYLILQSANFNTTRIPLHIQTFQGEI